MNFIKNLILFAVLASITTSFVFLSLETKPETKKIEKILKYEDIAN